MLICSEKSHSWNFKATVNEPKKSLTPAKRAAHALPPTQQKVQVFQKAFVGNQNTLPPSPSQLFTPEQQVEPTNNQIQPENQHHRSFPDPTKNQLLMAMLKSNNDFQAHFLDTVQKL